VVHITLDARYLLDRGSDMRLPGQPPGETFGDGVVTRPLSRSVGP
jgi:hypothetical protein